MRRSALLLVPVLLLTMACNPASPGPSAESARQAAGSGGELFAFLPTAGSGGEVISAAAWLEQPAGKDGPVRVADGHFVTGAGKQIRFFGTNLAFDGNFPEKSKADELADTLARLGFNMVRLHHMDTSAAPRGLWLPGKVAPRRFDETALDRLDYLVSRLAARGIYVDLNLHVGRALTAEEGFPEQPRPKYDKGISLFDPAMIEAHRAFARTLLGHVNPYTGRRYAADPAVAVVEITNENGLVQSFWAEDLDNLPARYAGELQAQWNGWLRGRYGTTAALKEAWGGRSVPAAAAGADLQAGSWTLEQSPGGSARFEPGDPLVVTVADPGSKAWGFQSVRPLAGVQAGQLIEVILRARADGPRKVRVNVMQAEEPWGNLGLNRELNLSKDWQEFRLRAGVSDTGGRKVRLTLSNLRESGARYEFSHIAVRTILPFWLAQGVSLEQGSVPVPRRSEWSIYPAPLQRDFMRFLQERETTYYADMVRFLKQDLATVHPVTGSQMNYSIGPVQAGLDYVDNHAYWEHPSFPGQPWDPRNWYIGNHAMVNAPGGGTLGRLGLYRAAGKPYTVSEYNHPAPNTFAAEGFILAGAYGSFQDWDGLLYFAFSHNSDYQPGKLDTFFDLKAHPTKLVTMPAAAALFLRGDVQPGREALRFGVDAAGVTAGLTRSGPSGVSAAEAGAAPELVLTRRLAVDYGGSGGGAAPPNPAGPVYQSDTGELRWDRSDPARAFATVVTPRSKAATGFVAGRTVALGDVTLQVGTTRQDWATVTLTDMLPGRLLITATGYVENQGMQLRTLEAGRVTVGDQWGSGPPMVEGVTAEIRLPPPPSRVRAWALDAAGRRGAALPVVADGQGSRLCLGPNYKTLWYEVAIQP
ncbi:MAG TPA: cellulase family glycosylhydrolase [Symbiobacteriaceae bacterium]